MRYTKRVLANSFRPGPPAMRFRQASSWSHRLVRVVEVARGGGDLEAARLVVDGLRPSGGAGPGDHLSALCDALETGPPEARATVGRLLQELPGRTRVLSALTESGIPGNEGFVAELVARLGRRVLPRVPDAEDLRTLLNAIFTRPDDHEWVSAVPPDAWVRLLSIVGVTAESFPGVGDELARAIRVIGHHVSSLGLSPEIVHRLPDLEEADSPFLCLGQEVVEYLACFRAEGERDRSAHLDRVLATVAGCREGIERLRAEKHVHGTSLHLTGLTFRLLTLLDRLRLLLHLTEPVQRDFQHSAVRLFQDLLRAEQTRDHLRPHLKASADLLAYQVVEHAARKGSKYITSGRSDYVAFLRSSMGGGLIVGLFALLKVILAKGEVPLAVEALLYGINYSLCFVLIYLTGATLATKQPAMTANTLARSLGEEGHELSGLEELVVRVWRSQFVSFLGNIVVALPFAILLSRGILYATGGGVADAEKATAMLADLHPWRSGALAYAAVAGLLLFAAGLLSGWVDNFILHRDVPERIARHPVLRRLMGQGAAERIASTLDRTLGVLVGNVFLGFGLGSMGTIGEILGLPLDIRHVAFSSAHFGAALDVLDYAVPAAVVIQTALGVAAIGLVNFLVSFGLSLAVAMESRGVTFGETRRLLVHLLARLRRRPLDWFVPPRTVRGTG